LNSSKQSFGVWCTSRGVMDILVVLVQLVQVLLRHLQLLLLL
jgi:hypothetical protein